MAKPRPEVEKQLPCELDEEELLLRGNEESTLVLELERLAKAKADFNAANKLACDKANARISELAQEITQKRALKPVRCTWEIDHTGKNWLLYRSDTGKVIDREPVTLADRQMDLVS